MAANEDTLDSEHFKNKTHLLINQAWTDFLSEYGFDDRLIYFDPRKIDTIVERYYQDVCRIKEYHKDIKKIDCHKIGGYLTYWICHFRPFMPSNELFLSVKDDYEKYYTLNMINEMLAYYVALARIKDERKISGSNITINVPDAFLESFLYTLSKRPLTGDLLSLVYYFIDELNPK